MDLTITRHTWWALHFCFDKLEYGMSSPGSKANPSTSALINSTTDKTVIDGYVHNVSDILVAKTGTRYFDFSVQDNKQQTRVVCFSPEKRSTLKEKERLRSAVTLANISPQKRKFDPESTEFTMGKYSRILTKKNLSFPWKALEEQSKEVVPIVDVVNDVHTVGAMVAVKGKVVSKSQHESVYSHNMRKSLNKSDAIVADSSSAIGVTLWEENIDDVKEGECYIFEGLRVSFYERSYFTTTKTSITRIDETIELSNDSTVAVQALKPESESESFIGKIIAADVTRFYNCVNCKCRTDEQNTCKTVVKCPSCKVSMLKQNMRAVIVASLIISKATGESAGRFLCPAKVLDSLFEKLADDDAYSIAEKNVSKLPCEMITETILLLQDILFTTCKGEKVVQSIEILDQDPDSTELNTVET